MVWVSSYRVPKDEWRAVNAVVWTVVNFFRLFHIVVLQSEYSPSHVIESGSVLMCVGAVGAVVGAEASKCIGEYAFRIFIIVLLIFGANTMMFAGSSAWEPILGVVITFMGVFFYSSYMVFINCMPDYPSAHRSSFELTAVSIGQMFGAVPTSSKSDNFGSVKYKAVTTDDDEDIGSV